MAGEGGARTLAQLQERLDTLADDAMERGDGRAEAILSALADWAEHWGRHWGELGAGEAKKRVSRPVLRVKSG